jgi:hypothetical protein
MILRDWEASMTEAGATSIKISAPRKDEYQASAIVAGHEHKVSGDDLQTVCARLLEWCRKESESCVRK